MSAIIDYLKLVEFDNNLIMAIVAINMTVIGLTSLADKKIVIGIDYGEFLIKEFKYFNLKMYYWLIIFALINIISLFTMLSSDIRVRLINFLILIFSLIFAIIYFFRFILIANKKVSKQIYMRELLGLYSVSNDTDHIRIDTIVKINNGKPTSKRLSTNVVNYFNTYNSETQSAFCEAFGPKSIIYSNKKYKDNIQYIYRESKRNNEIKDISFEFFQVFRFVGNQSSWALEILRIINGEYNKYETYDIFRLYNFARLTVQINTFGTSEDLFKYKFLSHYIKYWYSTVNKENIVKEDELDTHHILIIEKEIVSSLFRYIVKSIRKDKNSDFINLVEDILKDLIVNEKYKGFLCNKEILEIICKISIEEDCKILKNIIEKIVSEYRDNIYNNENSINIMELKRYINKLEIEQENNKEKREKLFNNK